MREFIDVTGKTEDEAIGKALAQLNLDRDDVSVEILERAKSGFLGIGSSPARVRIYYGSEEEEAAAVSAASPAPAAPAPREERRREHREETSGRERPESRPASPRPPRREDRPAAPRTETTKERSIPAEEPGEQSSDEKAQAIRSFLTGLLEHMGCPAEIRVYQPEKGRYKVLLEGKQMGALIGRRGETLDAIQQLTSYSVNRSGGSRVRVQLDAEGYREKREQSLQNLARKVAGKVVKYRRSVTLEPMNAYERHVIHTALQEVPGVTTYSTGMEPNRRVIVAYDRNKR